MVWPFLVTGACIILESSLPSHTRINAKSSVQSPTTTCEPVAIGGLAWLAQPPGGLLVCPHCFLAVLPSAASTELFISNPSSLVSCAMITHIFRMPSCPKHFTRGVLTGNPPSLGRGNSRFRGQGQLLGPSAWLLKRLRLDREPSPQNMHRLEQARRGRDS